MNPFRDRKSVLAASIAAVALLGSSHAGTYVNDFSTPSTTGLTLNGGARPDPNADKQYPAIEGGHLAIVYAENSEQGTVIWDDLDPGNQIEAFTWNMKLRIGGGSSSPADGLAFVFGNVDSSANYGEEGPNPVQGITVSFDIWDNGTDEAEGLTAPAIDVKVNNVTVLPAGHVPRSIQQISSDTFADLSIVLKRNGTLTLTYKGEKLVDNLFLPGYVPAVGDRFAIGGRTGGANANQWVDDMNLTTVKATAVAPLVTADPASKTVAEHGTAAFTVGFDGSMPITFQWFSNNVAVADATLPTLTLTDVSPSANGAKFKVTLTDATGNVTSGEATLTVTSDTTPPTIVSARGNETFNGVVVTFSEPVTSASAGLASNYSLSGGLTVSSVQVLNPTTVLLTTGAQTEGTSYTLTVNGVNDTALTPNTIAANSTKTFSSFVLSTGFLKFEAWNNIGGSVVQNLLDDPRFQANTPDVVTYVTAFTSRTVYPDDSHENYGARISGVIIPQESAAYRFFVSSDDASQLFLNPAGSDPAGLVLIAEETGCCNGFTEPGTARTSDPISLEAGQKYAVQLLYKEGTGGDYGQVAWRKEEDPTPAGSLQPISGSFLAAYVDPGAASISFSSQPTSRTAAENTKTTFTVAATGAPAPLSYQWQREAPGALSFADIAGATSASYTTPILKQATDNGAKYRVIARVPGASQTSSEATLTVIIDSTPPQLLSAVGGENQKLVTLRFSEGIDPTTVAATSHYTIPGLTVTAATLSGDSTILLVTSPQTAGQTYTVTVSGVKDSAGNLVDAAANSQSFVGNMIIAGAIKYEMFLDVNTGTAVSGLLASPKYPDSPDRRRLLASMDAPNGFGDQYGARLSGFVVPDTTGDYRFFIGSDDASVLYVSTDDSPANVPSTPTAEEPGCCNAFLEPADGVKQTSDILHLEAGKRYFIDFIFKEGGGGDWGHVAWRLEGDATAAADLQPIPGKYLAAAGTPAAIGGFVLSNGTAVGTGDNSKPGFRARIYQVDEPGANAPVNQIARAEQQLAGILGPNVADLSTAVDGYFPIAGVLNINQDYATGEVGDFTSALDPAYTDAPIPGIPGLGTATHNTDAIAGEFQTYVEFPAAGTYYMGVNSDDGFNVTNTENPPANNGAAVVTGSATASGKYHLVLPGGDQTAFPGLSSSVSGKLVYALPHDACDTITNPGEIAGNIALIDRGVCAFSDKAQRAKDAGAIAVIIINSRDPGSSDGVWPIELGGGFRDIPTFHMPKPDGQKLEAALAAGDQLNVSITLDNTPSLGQFDKGRGSSDTIFPVVVPSAGVFPLRGVWFEGGGGANVEWFSVDADGTKILLNDRSNANALKTYQARTAATTPTISITKDGNNVIITFTGHLYSADTVAGPFTQVAGSGSVTVSATAGTKFYEAGP